MTSKAHDPLQELNLIPGRVRVKGSLSGPNGACVEVSQDADTGDILVTNSRRPNDPPQRFTRIEWAVHLMACNAGQTNEWVAEELDMLRKQMSATTAAI
jgi:hypothetical protein